MSRPVDIALFFKPESGVQRENAQLLFVMAVLSLRRVRRRKWVLSRRELLKRVQKVLDNETRFRLEFVGYARTGLLLQRDDNGAGRLDLPKRLVFPGDRAAKVYHDAYGIELSPDDLTPLVQIGSFASETYTDHIGPPIRPRIALPGDVVTQ